MWMYSHCGRCFALREVGIATVAYPTTTTNVSEQASHSQEGGKGRKQSGNKTLGPLTPTLLLFLAVYCCSLNLLQYRTVGGPASGPDVRCPEVTAVRR